MANPRAKPAAENTGRLAYRNPEVDHYPDERPTLYWPHPFWKDEEERVAYERAAREIPRSKHLTLPLERYLSEVAALATGLRPKRMKSMPDVPQWDGRVW